MIRKLWISLSLALLVSDVAAAYSPDARASHDHHLAAPLRYVNAEQANYHPAVSFATPVSPPQAASPDPIAQPVRDLVV